MLLVPKGTTVRCFLGYLFWCRTIISMWDLAGSQQCKTAMWKHFRNFVLLKAEAGSTLRHLSGLILKLEFDMNQYNRKVECAHRDNHEPERIKKGEAAMISTTLCLFHALWSCLIINPLQNPRSNKHCNKHTVSCRTLYFLVQCAMHGHCFLESV